jgi:hypothetical protein
MGGVATAAKSQSSIIIQIYLIAKLAIQCLQKGTRLKYAVMIRAIDNAYAHMDTLDSPLSCHRSSASRGPLQR